MNFDLEKAVNTIISNKNFLKLKKVVENNAYHDHEPVYDHSVKTYETAKREITAPFISNEEAKEKFEAYIGQTIDGIRKRDLMLIFALIHDIGKMIVFEDNGARVPMNQTHADGTTLAPGHDYWGSLIVRDILKDTDLPEGTIDYLSKCVRLHNAFNSYWSQNKNASPEGILEGMKRISENMQIELIFNGYVDCFTAPPFQEAIPLIHKILNKPSFYSILKYSIMK